MDDKDEPVEEEMSGKDKPDLTVIHTFDPTSNRSENNRENGQQDGQQNASSDAELEPSDTIAPDEPVIPIGANDEGVLLRIASLEDDHRDLALAIEALQAQAHFDRLSVARLKKKKLRLKDQIRELRSRLTPDIIA